jgi:hypothetical protein
MARPCRMGYHSIIYHVLPTVSFDRLRAGICFSLLIACRVLSRPSGGLARAAVLQILADQCLPAWNVLRVPAQKWDLMAFTCRVCAVDAVLVSAWSIRGYV